jgi:hypothetical protein
MNSELIQPLLVGILVMLAVYIGLQRALAGSVGTKRAAALFAAAAGLLTTLWLRENPDVLARYSAEIVIAGIAVVLALLALARKALG